MLFPLCLQFHARAEVEAESRQTPESARKEIPGTSLIHHPYPSCLGTIERKKKRHPFPPEEGKKPRFEEGRRRRKRYTERKRKKPGNPETIP
jgi:hypothetical protein